MQFLHDKNPQVRQIALTNLLGHTPKDSLHRSIFFTGLGGGGLKKETENDYIRDLKILCRDQLVCPAILSVCTTQFNCAQGDSSVCLSRPCQSLGQSYLVFLSIGACIPRFPRLLYHRMSCYAVILHQVYLYLYSTLLPNLLTWQP